jgi:hypothetical protein
MAVVLHETKSSTGLHKSQVTMVTKFCVVAHNICGSSVWNLLHVILLAPRILRRLLDFWKIVHPCRNTDTANAAFIL